MKKILATLAVLAVAYVGTLFLIGNHTERLIKAGLARQPIPGNPGLTLRLTDYHRHPLSAEARFCLDLNAGGPAVSSPRVAALSGTLCLLSEVDYGPVLFGPWGVSLGWARTRTVVDLAALPASARRWVRAVYGDAPPLVSYGFYRFDGSRGERLVATPFDYRDQGIRVRLGGLAIDAFRQKPGALPMHAYLTLRDFHAQGPGASVTVDAVDGDSTLSAMFGASLPISSGIFAANGVVVSSGGEPLVAGNLTVRGRNRVENGLLEADLGVWVDGLHGKALTMPVDSGYLGLGYHGVDAATMARMRAPGALGGQPPTRLLQTLLRPGKSALSVQLMLDHRDQRQMTLEGHINYRGLDGGNPAPSRFRALGPLGWLRLVDADVHLDLVPALLPPAARHRAVAFVDAGVMTHQDGRLVAELTVKEGGLVVNGRSRSLDELATNFVRPDSGRLTPSGDPPKAPAARE